jgi:hypothetical protein
MESLSRTVGVSKATLYKASMFSYKYSLYYIDKSDFLVDEKYFFEIGGKNKGFGQIKEIENSFVLSDEIEIGFKQKIPLRTVGFLY